MNNVHYLGCLTCHSKQQASFNLIKKLQSFDRHYAAFRYHIDILGHFIKTDIIKQIIYLSLIEQYILVSKFSRFITLKSRRKQAPSLHSQFKLTFEILFHVT